MSTTSTKPITADELLRMGDIGRCEIIYGELVMMSPAGAEHGVVAMRLGRFVSEFVEQHDLGTVFAAETGFMIERNPDLLRAADAAFIAKGRFAGPIPSGFIDGVPDLAVEVISPGDTRKEVAEKVNMWLAHGTTVVWVADPQAMTILIHRVGHTTQRLVSTDEIQAEPLLPGFVLPLSRVFRRP
jgi:Uma2 family endonuclease